MLKNVNGISFQFFDESDVVRHHLVQRIIRAYEEHKVWKEQQMSLQLDLGTGEAPRELAAAGEVRESH